MNCNLKKTKKTWLLNLPSFIDCDTGEVLGLGCAQTASDFCSWTAHRFHGNPPAHFQFHSHTEDSFFCVNLQLFNVLSMFYDNRHVDFITFVSVYLLLICLICKGVTAWESTNHQSPWLLGSLHWICHLQEQIMIKVQQMLMARQWSIFTFWSINSELLIKLSVPSLKLWMSRKTANVTSSLGLHRQRNQTHSFFCGCYTLKTFRLNYF